MPLPVFRLGKKTTRGNMADVKKAFIDVRPVSIYIITPKINGETQGLTGTNE